MLEDIKSKNFIDFYSNLTDLEVAPGSPSEKEIIERIKVNLKVIASIPQRDLATTGLLFSNDGRIKIVNNEKIIVEDKYKSLKTFVTFTTHFFKTHHFNQSEVKQINQDLLKLDAFAKVQFDKEGFTSKASRYLYLNEIVDETVVDGTPTAVGVVDVDMPVMEEGDGESNADLKVKANTIINETIKVLQDEVKKIDLEGKKKSTTAWKAFYGSVAVGTVIGLTAVSTILAIGSLFTLIPTLLVFLPLAFLIGGFCLGKIAMLENEYKAVENKWNASIDKIKTLESLRDNLDNPQQINYLARFPNLVTLIRNRPDLLVEKSDQLLLLIEQEKLCNAKKQEIADFEKDAPIGLAELEKQNNEEQRKKLNEELNVLNYNLNKMFRDLKLS